MIYIIRYRDHYAPKVVTAQGIEVIERVYPDWQIYRYIATGNPVSVHPSQEWRVNREVIPNIRFNKYCEWR